MRETEMSALLMINSRPVTRTRCLKLAELQLSRISSIGSRLQPLRVGPDSLDSTRLDSGLYLRLTWPPGYAVFVVVATFVAAPRPQRRLRVQCSTLDDGGVPHRLAPTTAPARHALRLLRVGAAGAHAQPVRGVGPRGADGALARHGALQLPGLGDLPPHAPASGRDREADAAR